MSDGSLDLGIVIVSFNVGEILADCLTSLAAETRSSGLVTETWVVDNASSDGSAELVATRFPDVRIVALPNNIGFAGGNNVVLERWATAPSSCPARIMLLNPDTEMRPGSLATLAAALDERPRAAVVGPKLVYPDDSLQHSAFRFPGVLQTLLDLFPVRYLYDSPLNGRYPVSRYNAGLPFEVDLTLGACMLVRPEAVAEAGILDQGYRMYCEEVDWCRRFNDLGYSVWCVPEAEVVHHAGASTSQTPDAMFVELWRSRLRYFSKYEPAWRFRVLAGLVRLGLLSRSLGDRRLVARGRLTPRERDRRAASYTRILEGRVE